MKNKRSVLFSFPKTFWIANSIELFERWAWYGLFVLFANYLTGSSDEGGLEFSQTDKGLIMGIGTAILYFLPVITGAIADKYGYKRMLFLSFIIYASAFLLFPLFDTFTGVFLIYIYLAIGAAMFKPIIIATVAKTTNDKNSSIGFGIFYMMVNIGAFFGPMCTMIYKGTSYSMVFYISAGIIALNFIMLLFYKEPGRKPNNESVLDSIIKVGANILNVILDWKFLIFLIIVSGFWAMYFQLFFTLPVFIIQWVDTSIIYDYFHNTNPFFSNNYGTTGGQMKPEFITNLGALYIILLQIIVSTIVMKLKPLRAMTVGFLVCSFGMALTLLTQNVLFVLVAMFVFAIGEMAGSPKISEYIGKIAPSDKKALYMGYSYIPMFLGILFAGYISGGVYQSMSDKTEIVKQEVIEKGFSMTDGLSQNEYFAATADKMNMSNNDFTNYLWDKYNPSKIWYVILAIGLVAVVSLFLYDYFLIRRKEKKQSEKILGN